MANKAILLRSVSAIATAAASTAGGQHALAQDLSPGENGYYYSVQGGLMFSSAEEYLSELDDKVGAGSGSSYNSGFADAVGINGSVSFGKQLDDNWDVRGSASFTKGGGYSGVSRAHLEFSGSSYIGDSGAGSSSRIHGDIYSEESGATSWGFGALDFEVGYTPVLNDNFNVRLFAGFRGVSFSSKFDGDIRSRLEYHDHYETWASSSWSSGLYSGSATTEFEGTVQTKFTGVGPRAGAQFATRFEGTNFGLSGSVATSVLFGKKKETASGFGYANSSWFDEWDSNNGSGSVGGSTGGSGAISSSVESNATVLNLEASIGGDYYLDDSTALTIGYRGEKLVEVGGDEVGNKIDVLTHGPFVKLSGSF